MRLKYFFDNGAYEALFENIIPTNPLNFKDSKRYKDRLQAAEKQTGLKDAVVVGHGRLYNTPLICASFDFSFMGGSMGSVVGEKLNQAINFAVSNKVPLVVFSASGGARMQEGLFSLMQMTKTSVAINKLNAARLPFISVLTDPTMGGVSASFAMLGDVIIAEPKALIGFAGTKSY